jgi:beta-mannosidase
MVLSHPIILMKRLLATVSKRTGRKTIVLDQRQITDAEIALGIAPGNRWNFESNEHEIFCKGSNMLKMISYPGY